MTYPEDRPVWDELLRQTHGPLPDQTPAPGDEVLGSLGRMLDRAREQRQNDLATWLLTPESRAAARDLGRALRAVAKDVLRLAVRSRSPRERKIEKVVHEQLLQSAERLEALAEAPATQQLRRRADDSADRQGGQ